MILTITPNPSIDLLFETDTLVWDDANRVEMPRRRAGGQGINLTRGARQLGADSVALAFFGGSTGAELKALLRADDTSYREVPIDGDTRTFIAVRENATGRSMLVNPRGPVLTEDDRVQLLHVTEATCKELRPSWVVCSGSVPRGVGNDVYAHIGKLAHANGARFIADCDGEALQRAVNEGCDLLAPNQHEAERLMNAPILSIQEAGAAARSLLSAAPQVLIKLGYRGAVLANSHGLWHAHGPVNRSGTTVGAGDAFLASFLVAEMEGAPPYECLRRAVAAGAAVLQSSGTDLFTRADYERALTDVVVIPV